MTATSQASTDLVRVSTDTVRARDKVAFWADLVCQHLVQVDCNLVVEPEQFHAAISLRKIDKINLSRIVAGGQQVARTPQLMAKADSEYFLVNIQRSGNSGLQQDGRLAALKPGDMAIYTSSRRYDLSFNEDFSQTVLIFPADALRLKIPGIDALTATVLNNQNPAVQLFARMADNYFQTGFDALPLSAVAYAGDALTQLFAATVAAFSPTAETQISNLSAYHLTRIKQYVVDHFRDPALSVSAASQALGISPAHIHRLFEGESQTFGAWLWSCRLLSCKAELENYAKAHLAISEIAFNNGFNNSSHFSRAFRMKFGMTPREIRERFMAVMSERSWQNAEESTKTLVRRAR
jgi:AraC-like DNA-binding protein